MNGLRQMQKTDPTGTQNGIQDAFKQDKGLEGNQVLMAILKILGIDPAQMGAQ